ncbi:MAG: ComF family protein [Chloroflexi bacterium]|nr:ComF family protein [Chloroflexota bacterium]
MGAGLSHWVALAVDLVFPSRCLGCQGRGAWLCEPCYHSLPRPKAPVCRRCGRGQEEHTARSCLPKDSPLDRIAAAAHFEGLVREAIHRFKYSRGTYLAQPLARLLREALVGEDLSGFIVVPVPLHPKRRRDRGYNQAELLARELATTLSLQLVANGLVQRRETQEQLGLSGIERWANVRETFACSSQTIVGEKVLLVDDVCSTGATLWACASALKKAGARRVIGAAVARGR